MADIVILNYNDADTTLDLVNLIKEYEAVGHICVVDNASTDDSYKRLSLVANEKVDIVKSPKNGGYGYGNNYGIRYLKDHYNSDYILLCNPDVIISEEVIKALEAFLKENNDYIITAPFMLDKNGIKQNNTAFKIEKVLDYIMSFGLVYSKLFKKKGYDFEKHAKDEYINVEAVAGSLFMFNADHMIKHGMYDENVFLYCEERMLGMKCQKAGLKLALLPKHTFIHNHSVSINKTLTSEIKKRKVMNKSAFYIIKHYYQANLFELLLSKVMMKISIIEIALLEKIRGMGRRK